MSIELPLISSLKRGLIVSCQALPHEPLHGQAIMARMARAAHEGGAVGIRANGPDDVRAIREAVSLPLIGLFKDGSEGVYITPTLAHARVIAEAGADIIALDATPRPRPNGERLEEMVEAIHALGKLVMADISTFDEGRAAEAAGVDLLSTTLSGYTPYSPQQPGPDLELVRRLAGAAHVPVIAEGRISTPDELMAALEAGAYAVVVGGAITRPQSITRRFVDAISARCGNGE
jgi:putative N-acetylmannosamine-6-phosphate epimerase